VDIAMPRDIDSAMREVKGVYLYDLDDLENVVDHNAAEREVAAAEAQKILLAEAQGFRRRLMAERVVPTIVALRQRLDEICRQELESFRQENGPFSKDQDEMLTAVMARMTQRIAGPMLVLSNDFLVSTEIPGPRTEGTSRKGGTGTDDSSSAAIVPSANAGTGACRHHFVRRGARG
jgi:hypothetical protein